MSANSVNFTRGVNNKPVATEALEQALKDIDGLDGQAYSGWPLLPIPEGKFSVDACFIGLSKGVVLFDLVEGTEIGNYDERQDDLFNKVEARLKLHRDIMSGRTLAVPLTIITFAPAIQNPSNFAKENYFLANENTLVSILSTVDWPGSNLELFKKVLSIIQNLGPLRENRNKRDVTREDSRGAKLKRLEDSIATLDRRQSNAALETVDGVQRIRGLAGSGKTVVLARKAAYFHMRWGLGSTVQNC